MSRLLRPLEGIRQAILDLEARRALSYFESEDLSRLRVELADAERILYRRAMGRRGGITILASLVTARGGETRRGHLVYVQPDCAAHTACGQPDVTLYRVWPLDLQRTVSCARCRRTLRAMVGTA